MFETLVRESIGTALARPWRPPPFRRLRGDLLRLMLRGIGHFVATSDRVVLPKIIVAEAGNFPASAILPAREVIDRGLALLHA